MSEDTRSGAERVAFYTAEIERLKPIVEAKQKELHDAIHEQGEASRALFKAQFDARTGK